MSDEEAPVRDRSDDRSAGDDGGGHDVGGNDGGEDDEEWDVRLSDLDGADDEAADGPDDDADDESNVAGDFLSRGSIDPGRPSLENALFVVVGAFVTLLGLGQILVAGSYSLRSLATLTGAALLVTVLLFAFFGVRTPDT